VVFHESSTHAVNAALAAGLIVDGKIRATCK
jgi:hypothetical protein